MITVKNANPNQLHDELLAEDIPVKVVKHNKKEGDYIAENTWVTLSDESYAEHAQAIIDEHEPKPPGILLSETEELKLALLELDTEKQSEIDLLKLALLEQDAEIEALKGGN